jgi:hypothetical protein
MPAGKTYYTIEYESSSSRGDKHFICKVAIEDKKLYVLTAQVDAFLSLTALTVEQSPS